MEMRPQEVTARALELIDRKGKESDMTERLSTSIIINNY